MSYLRPGLLSDRSIALGGALPPTVQERLQGLGARTVICPELEEQAALEWAMDEPPPDGLVVGAGALESLDRTWSLIRAVATATMIPAARGAIVLLAPAPGAVKHAEAVRSALENLARTLSVEWSRFGITATAVAGTDATSEDKVATLVAYLCSAAGAYFSGCCLDLNCLG